jgi:hypothetical protein
MHNFGVLAQVLLNGESRFLSPCDFKELCPSLKFADADAAFRIWGAELRTVLSATMLADRPHRLNVF